MGVAIKNRLFWLHIGKVWSYGPKPEWSLFFALAPWPPEEQEVGQMPYALFVLSINGDGYRAPLSYSSDPATRPLLNRTAQ